MLSQQIKEIWSKIDAPTVISSPTYDDEGAAELFGGTTFLDHGDSELYKRTSCLTFFTDESFSYYLGAYLLYAADRRDHFMEVVGRIESHFQAPKGNVNRPSYRKRIRHLNSDQIECIILLLMDIAKEGYIDEDAPAIESLKQIKM